jgi:hypothetical protein
VAAAAAINGGGLEYSRGYKYIVGEMGKRDLKKNSFSERTGLSEKGN